MNFFRVIGNDSPASDSGAGRGAFSALDAGAYIRAAPLLDLPYKVLSISDKIIPRYLFSLRVY